MAAASVSTSCPMLHQNGGIVQLWDCNRTIQQSWSLLGML
jgi:hypothetical protein